MCAHPVFGMNDFNHIYSNIGYLIMGLLFIVLVRAKQRTTKCAPVRFYNKNPLKQRTKKKFVKCYSHTVFQNITDYFTRWVLD